MTEKMSSVLFGILTSGRNVENPTLRRDFFRLMGGVIFVLVAIFLSEGAGSVFCKTFSASVLNPFSGGLVASLFGASSALQSSGSPEWRLEETRAMMRKLVKRFVVAFIVAIPVWVLLLVLLFMLHATFYSNVSDVSDVWVLVKVNTLLLTKRIIMLSLIFAVALVLTDTLR